MTSLVSGETFFRYRLHIDVLKDRDLFAKHIREMAIHCGNAGVSPLTVAIVDEPFEGPPIEDSDYTDDDLHVEILYFRETWKGLDPDDETSKWDVEKLLEVLRTKGPGIHLLSYGCSYCAH